MHFQRYLHLLAYSTCITYLHYNYNPNTILPKTFFTLFLQSGSRPQPPPGLVQTWEVPGIRINVSVYYILLVQHTFMYIRTATFDTDLQCHVHVKNNGYNIDP
jgi:hypothetical protein